MRVCTTPSTYENSTTSASRSVQQQPAGTRSTIRPPRSPCHIVGVFQRSHVTAVTTALYSTLLAASLDQSYLLVRTLVLTPRRRCSLQLVSLAGILQANSVYNLNTIIVSLTNRDRNNNWGLPTQDAVAQHRPSSERWCIKM